MLNSSIRVLIVDDFEQWRNFHRSTVQKRPEFQIVGEASDGLEAVQQAEQLQPDLILLDIGLPSLNGIEVGRRIREVSPASKIVFVSENRSVDVVREALNTGAGGYVVKSDVTGELLPAIFAVLEGKRFVSTTLAGHSLSEALDPQIGVRLQHNNIVTFTQAHNVAVNCNHEVGLYSEDRHLLDHVTRFVAAALKAGNAAIVVATASHRESLLLELKAAGLDMAAAVEEGRYISLDAAETISMFMVNGMPDPVRFMELLGDLIVMAMEATDGANARVSVFGECVNLLWAQGNLETALQLEKLRNKLTEIHDVDILCGYSLGGGVEVEMDHHTFQQICAEHSAVYSW